jgi:penicillin amidase
MIESDEDGISLDDIKAMQADIFDLAAVEIVMYLEGLDLTEEAVSEYLKAKEPGIKKKQKRKAELDGQVEKALESARQSLLDWDGRLEVESSEAALYGFFFLELIGETFEDQYPYERWTETSHSRMQNAFYYLLEDPENVWWDDARTPDVRENRDDILIRAFKKGLRAGIERLGEKIEKWKWGDVHNIEFRNATLGESGIKLIENIFNRGPVPVSGGDTTVLTTHWSKEEPFAILSSVASRVIIDLGDLAAGLMMYAPGQSGHAGHRH